MDLDSLLRALPASTNAVERELITRAYHVAADAHEGQVRASGEPHVRHCLAVAKILLELGAPAPAIAAGLLHDTVEDTDLTLKDIEKEFGKEIASLVDGVTKLDHLPRVSQRREGRLKDREGRREDLAKETLRKTFLAMGDDVRVVVIKLADRLHNMRTLRHLPAEKRRRIAQETREIFAPLASRLGIWQMKWELEDLSFRYSQEDKYKEIAQLVSVRRDERERQLEKVSQNLERVLKEASIQAEVTGRPKHLYSIYKKMERKGVAFDQVFDVRGVRIVVPKEADCYLALGVIHSHWKPIPNTFDDYIATPKDNFYQSLHTAVVYEDGGTLEVQIRTPEMHQSAEYGIAAHWRYKEGRKRDDAFMQRINWLRGLMDWRQDVDDATDFVDAMKSDVFEDRVYAFSPKGDIYDLPAGSTPIDFAYHVHTDIGHRCRGAKVNGKLVTLDHKLQTGDSIEILTAKRGGPSRDWLNPSLEMVRTQRARSKIKQWFKRQDREQNISQGRLLLDREMRRLGMEDLSYEQIARALGFSVQDEMLAAIGCGDINLGRLLQTVVASEGERVDLSPAMAVAPPRRPVTTGEITLLGVEGLLTNLARCCNPAPGDPIVGYVTRGRGATVHRQDCPNVLRVREP